MVHLFNLSMQFFESQLGPGFLLVPGVELYNYSALQNDLGHPQWVRLSPLFFCFSIMTRISTYINYMQICLQHTT